MTEHRTRYSHHTLTVNGVRLAYRAAGPGGGDPLVLLPALGETADAWALVGRRLARERRVYAVDLRGHGGSGRPAEYSLELMRDDVLGLLDALGLDRVDLAGHSMGGVVAHLVAQAQPHRVVRLVLEDVPAPLPREAVAPVRPESHPDFDWDMVLAVRRQLDRPDPAWLEGLGRITAATLVVAGGPTSHVPQEGVAELARRIPDARLTMIPVGHLVHAAAPAEFTEAVSAFLDQLPDIELARRWLAEDGITQAGDGVWADADSPGEPLDRDDVANGLGSMAFTDERLDLAGRLRVALGLMDLLGGHFLVTGQVHSAHLGPEGPLPADLLWDGYRRRLEAVREYPAITDSLWFDWFEVAGTADEAFAEVLGNDRERLLPGAPEPLLRRARRVLEHSGPVSWPGKAETYRAAARLPSLHHAVFRAVLRSYHDVYGRLDPAEALGILDALDVPPRTEHLDGLRGALAAGHCDPRPALRARQHAPGPDGRAGSG
ncbi:alpha/beta fold hydrolase [Streptomyces sp. NPDC059989]|uniref:alpha/beta fold hydrolase n=1 Tax=Streptomyces sp. NPDC059989 TaxID=3347026 RepID=UPI00367BD9F1